MQPRLELMALGAIKGAERNPKLHDLDGIGASIRRFGFRDFPTLNEGTGRLIEGHGRIIVLKILKRQGPLKADEWAKRYPGAGGQTWPPMFVVEKGKSWHAPVVRGMSWVNDAEAVAYLAAHNQLTMARGWDEKVLGELLGEIVDAGAATEGLGFDPQYLEGLLAHLNDPATNPLTPPDEFPDADPDDMDTEHTCPKCGFEF